MNRIELVQGDITQLKVDVIVNAANTALLGGGGVDGAIHRAAGPKLLEACRTLGGCETGGAKLTKGYDLPAKYVIHAVGPVWHGGTNQEDTLLSSCYQAALKLVETHQLKTIAFPAISCGIYRFPVDRAAEIALKQVCHFLDKNPTLKKVYFVCFSADVYHAYEQALKRLS